MTHWLFGYGSLIWRVDFPYRQRRPAAVRGWARRFWQGSHDHRGTPDAPGRVATLIPDGDAVCVGVAYRVDEAVFEHLDQREKNGYERIAADIRFLPECSAAGSERAVRGVTYIAPPDNAAFLGAAPLDDIAAHILRSRGPSGSNADYLLALAAALDELGAEDEHVRELAQRVAADRRDQWRADRAPFTRSPWRRSPPPPSAR